MELLEIDLEGGSSWEPAAGAYSPGPQPPGARGRGCSSADSLAEEEEEEEEEEARTGRSRRTSSLVSGLLTELYSCGGRARHQDSVDSSTEASAGSDVFPGGRGSSSAESRFLQELQQRPSQRHQIEYLGQKDADELTAIVQELNYRICVQSAKLLRHLKQKDRLLHKVQKNCDIVTACLQAVSQKRRKIFKASILQMLKHKLNFNHVSSVKIWALNSDGEIPATVKSIAKLLLTLLNPGFHLACKSCKSEL